MIRFNLRFLLFLFAITSSITDVVNGHKNDDGGDSKKNDGRGDYDDGNSCGGNSKVSSSGCSHGSISDNFVLAVTGCDDGEFYFTSMSGNGIVKVPEGVTTVTSSAMAFRVVDLFKLTRQVRPFLIRLLGVEKLWKVEHMVYQHVL